MYEQKYMNKYDLHPLKVVGFEGISGVLTLAVLLWPAYFITFDKSGILEGVALGPEGRSDSEWRPEDPSLDILPSGLRTLLTPS